MGDCIESLTGFLERVANARFVVFESPETVEYDVQVESLVAVEVTEFRFALLEVFESSLLR